MTQTETPTPTPTPIELATRARVSCSLLEEEIADLVRKPTALRAKRTTERCARLWREIDALAARIEDQQQEIERLQVGRGRLPESDESDPSDLSDAAPTSDLRPPTSPLEHRGAQPLGGRPPGFQEVRRRMKRHGRRTDAIDRIKAVAGEGDHVPRPGRTNAGEWKTPQKGPRPWERFVKAVEGGRLPIDQPIGVSDLIARGDLKSTQIQHVQADLVIEGAPYRIVREGPRLARIVHAGNLTSANPR